tara:strand:+ start:42 stop:224 length:183 start_codon:yes stop_codon:yes gene_type:complete
MTLKETELLKVNKTVVATHIEINIGKKTETDEYYIRIGKAHYFNFGEALALLNDLEKHAE